VGGTSDLSAEERQAYALGRACFEQGDDVQALAWLERLLATRSGFADVHYMVGLLRERQGRLDEAAGCLERALTINPGYVEARLGLVTVLERLGEFDRARDVASRASARGGEDHEGTDETTLGKLANLQAAVGDAWREVGRAREAVEAYRKALALRPAFHDIRHRLGIALREAGLPAQALTEFARVCEANPDFLAASVQLGLTQFSLGRGDEALRTWQAVLARDAGREDARRYIRMVQGVRPAPSR